MMTEGFACSEQHADVQRLLSAVGHTVTLKSHGQQQHYQAWSPLTPCCIDSEGCAGKTLLMTLLFVITVYKK